MTVTAEALASLQRRVAERIEGECAAIVGTGQDLAVRRESSAVGREVRYTLVFQAIPGGSLPDYPCTVYRVSALGPFVQA